LAVLDEAPGVAGAVLAAAAVPQRIDSTFVPLALGSERPFLVTDVGCLRHLPTALKPAVDRVEVAHAGEVAVIMVLEVEDHTERPDVLLSQSHAVLFGRVGIEHLELDLFPVAVTRQALDGVRHAAGLRWA